MGGGHKVPCKRTGELPQLILLLNGHNFTSHKMNERTDRHDSEEQTETEIVT